MLWNVIFAGIALLVIGATLEPLAAVIVEAQAYILEGL